MWVGSIKLLVQTADLVDAGTDNLVTATVVRDGYEVRQLKLDYPIENDLEHGAVRDYVYFNLTRSNDQTLELPPGIGQTPAPYPSHGIEFSNGLHGHLKLRLRIGGDDMWIKDSVDLYVRQVRLKTSGIDSAFWQEDVGWNYIGSWPADKSMSQDPDEGFAVMNLSLA